MKQLLTGNEAIARGAFEAGVVLASAYPGTPSSEILANLAGYKEIYAEWAPNEKVSLEVVIGASMAGVRAIASLKHVGLNVAADPLFTFVYTGVNGGAVIIVADEPGQHSSQNEQDSRWYAQSAKVPMFEPANSQECLNMVKEAFALSEMFDTPVFVRMTTRVCHSKSIVECGERAEQAVKPYVKDASKYVMVPANARQRRAVVEKRMNDLKAHIEKSPLNFITKGGKTGVIASGVCRHYAREIFGDSVTYLDMGFTHPLPDNILKEFVGTVDGFYVIEENDPYLKTWVKAQGFADKLKDVLPKYGEMTPDVLRRCIGLDIPPTVEYDRSPVVPRPPALCAGCPHRGFFYELAKRKDLVVTGDIGCYTLGFAPPFNAMDSCVCMGGAFSIGHGFNRALAASGTDNKTRAVGVLGDSTFFHTGINSLIEVAYNGSNTVCIILDNRTTGMTGGQEHPGTGKDARGNKTPELDIAKIAEACGITPVITVNPNNLSEVNAALDKALAHDGPSVIITKWPCVLKKSDDKEKYPALDKFEVSEKCTACKLCLRCGCPAISADKNTVVINPVQCTGCGVCEQVCPLKAIKQRSENGD
ncbi:MAG: indolepyruvate ferredoxin oxidoreductase subunit alpha [Clostridiales bacterium]|jgi:indolepyruvate ferredoxin oxidoreductase alpha subunit|nr:indolepyruvate ferredoxin oxidoreductase subunit alpha [Clostridiales bacterium]